jgi:arylsulfatase A-like enzyme
VRAELINRVVKEFITSVKNTTSPFFIWIHYIDVHTPYISSKTRLSGSLLSFTESILPALSSLPAKEPDYFTKKTLVSFLKKNIKKILECYNQEIQYLDEQIGKLLEFLKRENIYENCVICLTSDHGDEFLEHDGILHSKLYNEVLHVPLLIKLPQNEGAGTIVNKKVSLLDLSPTICDIAKVPRASSFKGKNLFENSNSFIFHQTISNKIGNIEILVTELNKLNQCQMACQSENWKYIIDYSTGEEELYNLLEDPREKSNLSQSESKMLSRMRDLMEKFLKENPPFSHSEK